MRASIRIGLRNSEAGSKAQRFRVQFGHRRLVKGRSRAAEQHLLNQNEIGDLVRCGRLAMRRKATLSANVGYSPSGSERETRTPQLTLDDMEPLVELLGQVGGELAVGTIDNRSNQSLVRLRIDIGPEEPVAPSPADNSLERWQQQNAFRKQKAEFEHQQQAWQDAMQERITAFQTAVEPILSAPSNAQHSPVWDAVRRADLFLSEPQVSESEPHRYVVLITDGIDDVGAQPVPVHSGTRILMVNGAGQLGSLAVLRPQRYESIGAAVDQLVSLKGRQ